MNPLDDPAVERAAIYGCEVTYDPRSGKPYPRPSTAAPCPAWCDYDDVDSDGSVFHRTRDYSAGPKGATVSACAIDDRGAGTLDQATFTVDAPGDDVSGSALRDMANFLLSFESRVDRGNHPTDDTWPDG